MGKELNTVEINIEILESPADQMCTELNDLSLSLVGGGLGSVSF